MKHYIVFWRKQIVQKLAKVWFNNANHVKSNHHIRLKHVQILDKKTFESIQSFFSVYVTQSRKMKSRVLLMSYEKKVFLLISKIGLCHLAICFIGTIAYLVIQDSGECGDAKIVNDVIECILLCSMIGASIWVCFTSFLEPKDNPVLSGHSKHTWQLFGRF